MHKSSSDFASSLRHRTPTPVLPAEQSRHGLGLACLHLLATVAFLPVTAWSQTVAQSPASAVLIPAGSSWRFVDTGASLPPSWNTLEFDDRAWPQGPAQLGYGEGDEATELAFGPDPFDRIITVYLRKTFFATNALSFDHLLMDVLFDDGVVGYLNGVEAFRFNLPPGPITATTLAITNVSGPQEDRFTRVVVPATGLAATNVLALEVHQASPVSPDLSIDLRLVATNSTQIIRGPYLQLGTSNSAVIRWRTAISNATWVGYGTNQSNLDQVYHHSLPVAEHVVHLTGLLPDTRYFYRVGTDDIPAERATEWFRTDSPHARAVRIWAIGDAGTQSASQRAVRDAYLNTANGQETDVWLMLGDNAYGSGTDPQYQGAVFDMYRELLAHTFLWPTIGNHDTYAGSSLDQFPYLDIFSLPASGEAGGVPSGTEKYYSFNHANIHFVCLDSMASDRTDLGPMSVWLRADLAQTDRDWLIAFWHHPPYSAGSHNSDVEVELVEMRQHIVPILEAYGVDLVLSGHSHSYERSLLLHGHYGHSGTLTPIMRKDDGSGRPGETGPYLKLTEGGLAGEGTIFVVAGSAGQTGGGTLNHPAMHVSLNRLGSLVIDINGSRLDARFLRETGSIEDSFTLLKANSVEPLRIVSFQQNNGTVTARWKSVAGQSYQLESTEDVDSTMWTKVGKPVVATGATSMWIAPVPSGARAIYYRVVELP